MSKKIDDQEYDDQDQDQYQMTKSVKHVPIQKYDELGFDDEEDYEAYTRFIK